VTCLFARYPRANSPVTWPLRDCWCVYWQIKEYVTLKMRYRNLWFFYVTSKRDAQFWSQLFLVENSKEEINFRLKTSSCIKHRVIVVLWGRCTVVWCYWTSHLCLALFTGFVPRGGSRQDGSSSLVVLSRKSSTVRGGRGGGSWEADPSRCAFLRYVPRWSVWRCIEVTVWAWNSLFM